jgi:hypothetical protein
VHAVRVATSISTLQERLEAAETAYHEMMAEGRGIVEYTEPGTNLRVRKDPAEMRKYLEYLRGRVSVVAGASSRSGNTTYATMRRPS